MNVPSVSQGEGVQAPFEATAVVPMLFTLAGGTAFGRRVSGRTAAPTFF